MKDNWLESNNVAVWMDTLRIAAHISAWQLLCAASPVATTSQVNYECFLQWLFHLCSHWKTLFTLSTHLDDDFCGVCLLYFWQTYATGCDCPRGEGVYHHII